MREDEESVTGHSSVGASDVLDWWRRSNLERDSWLLERGSRPLAIGWVDPLGGFVFAVGAVRPEAHAEGLGGALVDLSEARTREQGVRRVHQFAIEASAAASQLFEARGYDAVRRYYEMAIELGEPPPEPRLPDGLEIETFREEDAGAWHAASTEAFEEEWGFVAPPFEEWWELRSKAADFDPSLWFLVRDGGEIAAVARCEAGRRGGGFVGMLGVRKPWRRRGLGSALLEHAFREFHARGERRVSLGVDSENPTGATRLYQRAGMHVEAAYVTYAKDLQ